MASRFLVIAILLSGCVSNHSVEPETPKSQAFQMEGCDFGGSISYPPGEGFSSVSGWNSTIGFARPTLNFGTCERVHLTEAVVGPVSWAYMRAGSQSEPNSCRMAPDNGVDLLQWGIADNAIFVKHLQDLGAPFVFSDVRVTVEKGGDPSLELSWQHGASEGDIQGQIADPEYSPYDVGRNLAWAFGDGVAVWEQRITSIASTIAVEQMLGSVDPTLPGTPSSRHWAGNGLIYVDSEFKGKIHTFSDVYCKSPTEVV